MINGIKKETIVSTTEDRLTLLNWLKTLSDDKLTDIAFTDNDGNVSLALTFEDGTTKSVAFPYDMSALAKKSEVTSGLALKADIAGQAFTGGITAPSIIEDMSGYGYVPVTKENANITYTYVGTVKNGNKLTFACSGYFSRSGDLAGGNCVLVRFTFPQAIGVKLNKTEISGVSGLAFGKIDFCKNYANHVDVPIVVFKESNSQIAVTMYNLTATYNIEINTPYLFRFEITFLLSDNLAL